MFGEFILQIKYFGMHIFSKIPFEKEYNGGWYMLVLSCSVVSNSLWPYEP